MSATVNFLRNSIARNVSRHFSTTPRLAASQMTVRDALNAAIDEEMERDDKVCSIRIVEKRLRPISNLHNF